MNVQSEVAEDEDEQWAMQTLERIRTRLRRRSVLDALLAVDVALIEVGTAQNVSTGFDGRVWSIGNLDVTFCAAVNDTDPIPTGWIERVVLSSRVRDAGGNVLPPPSNFTNETIPE